MKKEDPPIYIPTCNPLTIKHILTECKKYELQRQKYKLTHYLSENLSSDTTNTLKFLKDNELQIKIYNCIYIYRMFFISLKL